MARTVETVFVQREITIDASPATVWEFLVDEEKAIRWMGLSASLDPRPGGLYLVEVIPGHTARGEFVEVDAPHRLVFTWGWDPEGGEANAVPPGSSAVEVELVPEGNGTKLLFTHRDLPSRESAESHAHGWDHYLSRLATTAPGGDPGADPWLTAVD
ncbi:MAG TPA: SRPBCC family protein [Gaiellaceae bacterium]|jgi:uncharacterized protein YndB with AHSA1/START domain